MKKLLLIAAMAALALGASAEGYKFEKVWERTDVASLYLSGCRQGVAINGKFYINNTEWNGTGIPVFYVYGEEGEPATYDGFANTAVTRDEAGHLIVSTVGFPGNIAGSGIKVLDPATMDVLAEYTIPEECGLQGRCDFFGIAKGDMTDEGVMYLTGGNTGTDPYTDGVAVFAVSGGEVDFDNSYLATVDPAVVGQTSTVINYYKDLNGEDALVYAYRSGAPSKLVADGDNFTKTSLVLPNKGACNGIFPFVWDGMELFIYPTLPNYQNGFAIAESGAEAPLFEVPSTVAANPNGYQANWLYAEVDADGVYIYQYAPGSNITVWRLTKDEVVETPNVYILGEVNDQYWAANAGTLMEYDAENNVYTATVHLDGRGESGENYFSFTTELANDNDEGGWAYIEPFRFGAVSEGDFWYDDQYDGQPLELTFDNYQAFRVMGGDYNLTVSLENQTLIIERVQPDVLRGDVNQDTQVNISDVTALINILLTNGEAIPEADTNKDTIVNISDVTALINYLLTNHW